MNLGSLLNKYVFSISGHQLVRIADLTRLKKKRSEALYQLRAHQKASQDSVKTSNVEFAERLSRLEEGLINLVHRVDAQIAEVLVEQDSFLALARLLLPHQAVGFSKIRLGREFDGGYVVLDDFEGIEAAYSFGIGDDCSFDVDLAERGIRTFQFDHTIDHAPAFHPNISFFQRKIVGSSDEDGETIEGLLDRHACVEASLVLKMDIEGGEWLIFEHVEPRHLRCFAQIVCEFHHFGQATNDAWYNRAKRVLNKLTTDFAVVHVHGNNVLPFVSIGNVPFPPILEVTFANRARYEFLRSEEIFPTLIDRPNIGGRPDLFLGRFMF